MSRDHGGNLDAAIARYGGARADWLDLSTGINPVPYPLPDLAADTWTALPDAAAQDALLAAARRFWQIPDAARILAAPGASALIARLPALIQAETVYIPGPTYNEHAAAFAAHGARVQTTPSHEWAPVHVHVHPNNPDGRLWPAEVITNRPLTILDESFCDTAPDASHIAEAARPGALILKSFGKFWGLAGLRLGFAIAHPDTLAGRFATTDTTGLIRRDTRAIDLSGQPLADLLGPWPVSGPAIAIATAALSDPAWAAATNRRLSADAARLDTLMTPHMTARPRGTALFRLYDTADAAAFQARLARHHIWSRTFPWSPTALRLGLPHPDRWPRIEAALAD